MRWMFAASMMMVLAGCPEATPPADGDAAEKTAAQGKESIVEKAESDEPVLDVPAKTRGPQDCADSDPAQVDMATLAPMSPPEGANPALLDPTKATEQAPKSFRVKFTTTKGEFVMKAYRPWSPAGVDRFYNLVKIGFFDGNKFFRAVDNFMIQFGITPYPAVNAAWSQARFSDDPVVKSNIRGMVTFAKCGAPDCRSTQLFINTVDRNRQLDAMGFAPFAVIESGMEVVDALYTCYGDMGRPGDPRNKGPNQGAIQQFGNAYLEAGWPKLDGVIKAEILAD